MNNTHFVGHVYTHCLDTATFTKTQLCHRTDGHSIREPEEPDEQTSLSGIKVDIKHASNTVADLSRPAGADECPTESTVHLHGRV